MHYMYLQSANTSQEVASFEKHGLNVLELRTNYDRCELGIFKCYC